MMKPDWIAIIGKAIASLLRGAAFGFLVWKGTGNIWLAWAAGVAMEENRKSREEL